MNAILSLDAVWKSALLLAGAGAVAIALRRASASARHLVWTLASVGSLLLPLLALAVPAWTLAVLPDGAISTVNHGTGPRGLSVDGRPSVGSSEGDNAWKDRLGRSLSRAGLDRRASDSRMQRTSGMAIGPVAWVLIGWSVVAMSVLAVPLVGSRLGLMRIARDAAAPWIEGSEWRSLV